MTMTPEANPHEFDSRPRRPRREGTPFTVAPACAGCGHAEHREDTAGPDDRCIEVRTLFAHEPDDCPHCRTPLAVAGFAWGDPTDPTIALAVPPRPEPEPSAPAAGEMA